MIEQGLAASIGPILAANLARVEEMLKSAERDLLSSCLYATANWVRVLAAAGVTVRTVGGVGRHIRTEPPEPPDRVGGYMTDDDGLVQHWWLMVEPHGLIFDPTAHQFDRRGGVAIGRYWVAGEPLLDWRRDWPARSADFAIPASRSGDANWRTRLGLRDL